MYRGRPVPIDPQGHTERDGQEDQHRAGEAAEHTQQRYIACMYILLCIYTT